MEFRPMPSQNEKAPPFLEGLFRCCLTLTQQAEQYPAYGIYSTCVPTLKQCVGTK